VPDLAAVDRAFAVKNRHAGKHLCRSLDGLEFYRRSHRAQNQKVGQYHHIQYSIGIDGYVHCDRHGHGSDGERVRDKSRERVGVFLGTVNYV